MSCIDSALHIDFIIPSTNQSSTYVEENTHVKEKRDTKYMRLVSHVKQKWLSL